MPASPKLVFMDGMNLSELMDVKLDKSILIIDSNYFISNLVSRFLESAGYKVFIAQDAIEGVETAISDQPSVILCNTELNGRDGFDVISELSSYITTNAIPFLFMSSKPTMDDIRKGMALGADSFLIRPFVAKDLLNIINNKLSKVKSLKELGLSEYVGELIHSPDRQKNNTILVNYNKKRKLIKKNEIEYITAHGAYTDLYIVGKGRLTVRKLLKEWEKALTADNFLKINRSNIINTYYIKNIEKIFSRSLKISMENSNENFITSQRYTVKVRAKLKNELG